jgi:outer membrane lipoprotein-sorting protein
MFEVNKQGGCHMRYALAMLVLLPVAVAAQDGSEAEKLFRNMETRITSAKTLQVNYETVFGEFGKMKGSLAVAAGNKVCLEQQGEIKDKAFEFKIISDGAMTKTSGTFGAKEAKETPNMMGEKLLRFVSRGGIGPVIFQAVRQGERENPFDVSDFKLGKKEKIGDRAAQIVEYDVQLDKGKTHVSVWLDVKTSLPIKRELTVGDSNIRVTETYSAFNVNGQIDPKKFELPN